MLNILIHLKLRPHQALIYISLLTGAWLMIESLTAIFYILKNDRSMTLVYLYLGILLFGALFFTAGLLLKFGKKVGTQAIFFVAMIFSTIRWLKYRDMVFPFGAPLIYHHNAQSGLYFLWETQHFAIAIATLVLALLTQWTGHRRETR